MDGTLLCPAGRVTPRTQRAIRQALDAGVLVCFATGRNYTESREVLAACNHHAPAVFGGGATVVDPATGQGVHTARMDPALARELSAFLESHGQAVCALQDHTTAGVDYLISQAHEMNRALSSWLEVTSAKYRLLPAGSLAGHAHTDTVRIGFVAPTDEVNRIAVELDRVFGPRIVSHAIHVPSFGVHVLEAFDPAVNKWTGIEKIASVHGIAAHEVIAIGDDVNDVSMLRSAGLGVAMGNARDDVKAVAARVIGSNADDGLAEFLEELIAARSGTEVRGNSEAVMTN